MTSQSKMPDGPLGLIPVIPGDGGPADRLNVEIHEAIYRYFKEHGLDQTHVALYALLNATAQVIAQTEPEASRAAATSFMRDALVELVEWKRGEMARRCPDWALNVGKPGGSA